MHHEGWSIFLMSLKGLDLFILLLCSCMVFRVWRGAVNYIHLLVQMVNFICESKRKTNLYYCIKQNKAYLGPILPYNHWTWKRFQVIGRANVQPWVRYNIHRAPISSQLQSLGQAPCHTGLAISLTCDLITHQPKAEIRHQVVPSRRAAPRL